MSMTRDDVLRALRALGPAEPYRIKMVESIRGSSRAERQRWLAEAGYNLFLLRAEYVALDLLTDSGTGAMSQHQWAALIEGDESYAGARSYYRFEASVREVFGLPEVIPTHQGRAAEFLLFRDIVRPGQIVLSNTFFDTTRANVEQAGGRAVDLPCPDAEALSLEAPFKGNVDLARLARCLEQAEEGEVAAVVMTLTNNAAGGQPAALDNVQACRRLCQAHDVPLIIDACRIAENAFFIKERDPSCAGHSVASIVRRLTDCADIVTMSAKKDGLANIGGFLALRSPKLAEQLRQRMVVHEGFVTYGGLAGRDLEAIAVGLREAQDEAYLAHRIGQVRFLADLLRGLGVPIVEPPGGHGLFVDAGGFLPHIPPPSFPGQALAVALYLEAGIRSCEIGSVMFGADPTGRRPELLRLAVPRRVYSNTQLGAVAVAMAALQEQRERLAGMRMVYDPGVLRHFSARFEPLPPRRVKAA